MSTTTLYGGVAHRRVTILDLKKAKTAGEKWAMLTSYEQMTAEIFDTAGIPVLLVGDSAGNNFLGEENTIPVTVDEMIPLTRAVVRGSKRALVIADLPFGSYESSPEQALATSTRFFKEAGAMAVKLEGAHLATVEKLTSVGIPVMGHLGLTPQSLHQLGGYRVQGREDGEVILQAALALEKAGAFAIVLELVPAELAAKITAALTIPTVGIGAGRNCDAQVLVWTDLVGLTANPPKLAKAYRNLRSEISAAAQEFAADVRGEPSLRPKIPLTNPVPESKASRFAIDLTPLKKYPDFRNLWSAGLITYMGSMITYVAVPFQIKELTNSYIAVGLSGVVEIVPLILFGLYGGVLADYVDRKKMVWVTEFVSLLLVAILLANSFLPDPNLILIYVVIGLFAAVNGLQRPSADAILPRLVGHDDLPAASALMSLRWQVGVIIGPAIGGILISSFSISVGYMADIATFLISLAFLARVRNVPANPEAEKPSLAGLIAGVHYACSRQDLLGTYLVDLAAMFFAMPTALIPFWADELGSPWALGFLYAAGTVGSVIVTLTSGWTKRYRFHGRAVIWAALGWGAAIALAGLSNSLILVLLFLALAGGADMVSALFRATIWNQTIPDELRGRLAGIELLSYSVGPLAGQMRAASMAAVTSLNFSVTSGGVLCIISVAILAIFLPKLRKYDAKTNEYAVQMRKVRAEGENFPENR